MASLRDLASKCGFTDFSARMLDQFIMGLQSRKAQEHLLQCDLAELTMTRAFEKVCTMYRSRREALNFRINDNPSTSTVEVHGLQSTVVCSQCGLKGHVKKNYQTKCHGCKQTGHIRKNCSSKKKYISPKKQFKRKKHVNQVVEHFVGESLFFCEELESSVEYLEENIIADLQDIPNIANDKADNVAADNFAVLQDNSDMIRLKLKI